MKTILTTFVALGLSRLSFIRHSRDLGFSAEDIRGLVELNQHPEKPCSDTHSIAAQHLQVVQSRISKFQRLERELNPITKCDAGNVAAYAVIETPAEPGL